MYKIKNLLKEFECLMRSVPGLITGAFFVALVCMNILANKTIVETPIIACDGGILIGWVTFMCMDVITMRFGPRASTMVAVASATVNVLVAILFKITALIPTPTDFSAFNTIVGGTWFITLSSVIAQVVSSVVNNFSNYAVGKMFKRNNGVQSRAEYICRSYVSTFVGQFVDNMVFGTLAFIIFAPLFWDGFHWTLPQAIFCSFVGAIIELLSQVLFSPIGYKVIRRWERDNVGAEYIQKYLAK